LYTRAMSFMLGYKNNNIYITDIIRGQWGVDERDKVIKQTCDLDGRIPQIFPSDPGAAGKSQINYLFRMLSGHNLVKVIPTGKKEIRAEPIAAQINVGNVYLLKSDWNKNFIDELRQFPLGKHDDQVDSFSQFAEFVRSPTRQLRAAWV